MRFENDELFYCIDYDRYNIPYIIEKFYAEDKEMAKYIKHNPIFKTKAEAKKYLRDIWGLVKRYKRR